MPSRIGRRAAGLVAVAGPALLGYGWLEARRYRTAYYRLPVLPAGASPVRVLQVSDLHLRRSNRRLSRFVESLSGETYDVVLATGDLLGEPRAVDECIRLLNGLKANFARCVVFGSSDYYAPVLKNYFDYFANNRKLGTRRNPTGRLRSGLISEGWHDLTNRTIKVELNGLKAQFTGLDDPYLNRDDRTLLHRKSWAKFAMCVVHDPAPYRDAFAAGYNLVVAGHTHGGQIRLPLLGAVVTNSELPTRYARGPSAIGTGTLFVTPGLGTGKFAPVRFLCPPEASVLKLVAEDEEVAD